MKNFCKVFALAAVVTLAALPAAADDVATFHLGQPVVLGATELPAGAYTFHVSSRGLVVVYDETGANVVATALANKVSLQRNEIERAGTLAHDWAVRSVALGDFDYLLFAGERPASMTARADVPLTVVAQVR